MVAFEWPEGKWEKGKKIQRGKMFTDTSKDSLKYQKVKRVTEKKKMAVPCRKQLIWDELEELITMAYKYSWKREMLKF